MLSETIRVLGKKCVLVFFASVVILDKVVAIENDSCQNKFEYVIINHNMNENEERINVKYIIRDTVPQKDKQIKWSFSVPYVNSFLLYPIDEGIKVNTGFWGLTMGVEYHYNEHNFLDFTINGATDFFVPVPTSPGIDGEYESMSTIYFSLEHNKQIKRFSVGYGLNYSFNNWKIEDHNQNPTLTLKKYSGQAIGFSTNVYYNLFRLIHVGIVYRPSVFRLKPMADLKYEHLISLDFAIKFDNIK